MSRSFASIAHHTLVCRAITFEVSLSATHLTSFLFPSLDYLFLVSAHQDALDQPVDPREEDMTLSRRNLAGLSALAVFGLSTSVDARPDEVGSIKDALEALRKAMLAADKKRLDELTTAELSYGHSSGVIQSKAVFIDVIASKKTVYKQIDITDVTVAVVGRTAILRHAWNGISVSDGKESPSKIGVLQAWTKVGSVWQLIGRQGYKV
jgi:uncharacterized protein DUF4440